MTPWTLPFLGLTAFAILGGLAVSVEHHVHRRRQERWLRRLDHDIAERRQTGDALGGGS